MTRYLISMLAVLYIGCASQPQPMHTTVIHHEVIPPTVEKSYEVESTVVPIIHEPITNNTHSTTLYITDPDELFAIEKTRQIYQVQKSITILQPYTMEKHRAWYLGQLITKEAKHNNINPHLIAALIMRESSYDIDIEQGRRFGSKNEIGLMQLMPNGAAIRHGDGCDPLKVECNIKTGIKFLSTVRTNCASSDTWVWVAAYGMSRCPSPHEARKHSSVRRAKELLCKAREDCNEIWPE